MALSWGCYQRLGLGCEWDKTFSPACDSDGSGKGEVRHTYWTRYPPHPDRNTHCGAIDTGTVCLLWNKFSADSLSCGVVVTVRKKTAWSIDLARNEIQLKEIHRGMDWNVLQSLTVNTTALKHPQFVIWRYKSNKSSLRFMWICTQYVFSKSATGHYWLCYPCHMTVLPLSHGCDTLH